MIDAIVAHARRDHPDECCGVIVGAAGRPTRLIAMDNADRSPTGFTFDSAQWLRVYREVDDADEEFLVVYHSHTMTEAYPSRTDILWSRTTPFPHWLLVSTRSPDELELRSYTIVDGTVAEEQVRVRAG
jgi:proteasome lid subunit RPN8/RPN11